ncbi:MAG TPA: hypothetical protein V6D48_00265 [Oculatellaceae cyanobacterium]
MNSSLDQDCSEQPNSKIYSTLRSLGIESILEKLDEYIFTEVAKKREQ